jgi:hypothetical protein
MREYEKANLFYLIYNMGFENKTYGLNLLIVL